MRNWLTISQEESLLDQVAQRRQRFSVLASSITPQMGQLANAYGDAYPWMDPNAVQSFVQAGLPPDLPQVQAVADLAARQAAEEGQFDDPSDDVPDSWLESLTNAVFGWVKPVVRTGFTILATPFEEVQAFLSAAGTAILDETESLGLTDPLGFLGDIISDVSDVDALVSDFWTNYTEKAARSSGLLAVADLLQGKEVHLGEGFLPGPRFDAEGNQLESIFEEREQAKQRLRIDGQFVTPGRLIARQFTPPGTGAYQFLSGLNDFAQNLTVDPIAAASLGLSKAAKATRAFQATGIINGVRRTVAPEVAVNHYLTSDLGRKTIRWFTDNTDLERAWKNTGRVDLDTARRLAASTSDAETFGVLSETLGTVIRQRPNPGFISRGIGGLTSEYGRLFGGGASAKWSVDNSRIAVLGRLGRLGDDVPARNINIHDPNDAARQLDLWMRNAGMPRAVRSQRIAEMASVEAGDQVGMFEAVRKVMDDTEGLLVTEWGVRESVARRATSLYENLSDDLVTYDLDDLGRHVDVLAPLRINLSDEIIDVRPTPGLISELVNDIIPLPDARVVRRLTPVVRRMQRLYDSGLWKGSIDGLDTVMSAVWKPLQLLRGAYLVRVVGEEQVRMAGAGYDSLFRHPVSGIAWSLSIDPKSRLGRRIAEAAKKAIDPKGTQTVTGEIFEEIAEHAAAMSRGSAGWRGLPGEVLTGRFVKARFGDEGFHRGWAVEFAHQANDPVMRRVAGGLGKGDLRSIGRSAGKGPRLTMDDLKGGGFFFHKTRRGDVAAIEAEGLRSGGFFSSLEDTRKFGSGEQPIFVFRRSEFPESVRGADVIESLADSRLARPGTIDALDDLAIPRPVAVIEGGQVRSLESIGGEDFDDVAEWFWSGTGQKWRKDLGRIEGRSRLLTDRTAADEYLRQNYFDRLRRMTSGDPDLVELVAKGHLDEINLRGFGHETKLSRLLEDSYGTSAPRFVKTPEVVTVQGPGSRTAARLDRGVERAFEGLMSRPTNWLSRSPTFRQKYWQRVEELIGSAPAKVQKDAVRAARAANVGGSAEARMATRILQGEGTKIQSLDDADLLAKAFALSETKKLLYDLSKRNQFFDVMRLVFPFGEAWKEIITAWTTILRQNPQVIRRFQQGLEGARAPSLLGETETTPGSGEGFFHPDPQTGEEVFTYPGGGWISKMLLGEGAGQLGFVGRVSGLNLFTATVLPGFGPVIQIPATKLLPQTPQWDDVRDILLPFGESEGIFDSFTPAWFDKVREVFSEPDPEKHRLFANTVGDVMRALVRGGEYDTGTVEGQQVLLDDATAKAKILYAIRGAAQFVVPTGPSFQWSTADLEGNIVPVKILSDELRRMTNEEYGGDRQAAFTEWVRRFGVDNLLATIGKSTALVSRPVTEKGDAWLRDHPDLERTYETTIGFFAPEPNVGEFDYNAYLRQFETGARETLSPAEQLAIANDFLGRIQWEQAKRIAEFRPSLTTSVWLAQVRDQIAEKYPGFDGWVARRIVEQRPDVEQMIAEIRKAVTEEEIAATDAGKGTILYLSAMQIAELMVPRLPGTATRYQQAKSAAPIRAWLRSVARQIITDHPDFARVWTGVFERELADDEGIPL